jgi:ZIP family zinc transporter
MIGEIVWLGAVASLIAGLATGAGSLPVLFTKKISDRMLDVMLGFSAGIMLAATSFSLIVPAIDLSGPWVAVIGILLGAITLHMADRFIPHFHPGWGAGVPLRGFPEFGCLYLL